MQHIPTIFTAFFSFKYWQVILIAIGFFLLLSGSLMVIPFVGTLFWDRGNISPEENIGQHQENTSETASVSAQAERGIVVEVSGAVVSPGLYELSKTARIKDALDKAGGILPTADHHFISQDINLAQKVIDAEKIYIPFQNENFSSSNAVSVNAAKREELLTLPGLTKTKVEQLLKLRPFSSIDDVQKRLHFSLTTWSKLKPFLKL